MNINILMIIISSYLIGSISSSIIICKFMKLPDPRSIGSKNPGATNILRINYKIAVAVMLFDTLKGIIAMKIGCLFNILIPPLWLGIIAITVCIGHMYPIFFKFHGGKGVATALGALTMINWHLTAISTCLWLTITLYTRYASLGSIIVFITIPLISYWLIPSCYLVQITILSILILFKHYDNIKRILNKCENRI